MLYLIAAVLAALLGGVCWRYRALRRALIRERVAARLGEGAAARDVAALEHQLRDAQKAATREAYVLADAAAVIDAAYVRHRFRTDIQEGGSDA